MANLFLDKAGAEGVVSLVNQQIEALMEAAKQIDSDIMQQMPNYWQGVAHDKAESTYMENYREFLNQKVPEMVTELNQFMRDCVQAIADVDSQLAGK